MLSGALSDHQAVQCSACQCRYQLGIGRDLVRRRAQVAESDRLDFGVPTLPAQPPQIGEAKPSKLVVVLIGVALFGGPLLVIILSVNANVRSRADRRATPRSAAPVTRYTQSTGELRRVLTKAEATLGVSWFADVQVEDSIASILVTRSFQSQPRGARMTALRGIRDATDATVINLVSVDGTRVGGTSLTSGLWVEE